MCLKQILSKISIPKDKKLPRQKMIFSPQNAQQVTIIIL